MITVKRFTASWCAPCRALAPILANLANEMPGVQFETIDIDNNEDETQLHKIRSVPTVLIVNDGTVMDTIIGLQSKQRYVDAINAVHKS